MRQKFAIRSQQADKDYRTAQFYEQTGHPGSAYFYYEIVRRRYPGTKYSDLATERMKDLKLNEDRETLKRILESAVPQTLQDVVLIYASVTGTRQGELFEDTYVKKIYPQKIHGRLWSAIQVTTASALCSVVDLVLNKPAAYQGFVTQETFPLANVIGNRFGACFR